MAKDAKKTQKKDTNKKNAKEVRKNVKKVNEMIIKMEEWNQHTDNRVYSDTYIINNSDEKEVTNLIKEKKQIIKKN